MFFSHENTTIYYEKHGEGKKAIVILPGWGDNRTTFNYLINSLSRYFTIYVLDYPGFGRSPIPSKFLNIFSYSNLVYEWLKKLELKDPILIGHSFGGRIIITLSGYYKYKYNNIILIDSAGIKPRKNIYKIIRIYTYKLLKLISKIIPRKYKQKYINKVFGMFASPDYQNLNEHMRETFKNIVNFDLKTFLKNINSKTLIIWGKDDDATPVKDAIIMNKYIKDSELIVLEGCGHFPYIDKPSLVNCIILEQIKTEIRD